MRQPGVGQCRGRGVSRWLLGAPDPRHSDSALYARKILLTDNAALIIGSQNLTTTSLLENRELSLALDTTTARDLIAAVESTVDADYATAAAQ
jgi:phosphatidylserine/phosphatidylglycerophosphate/cardiolipin synthase-like enzyme